LQVRGATPETRAALNAAIERVNVMGRVTDRLSYRETQSSIDAREFIGNLCRDLQLALVSGRPIALAVEVEPVALTMAQASLVGLIVNELVTNALKHAFSEDQPGRVTVQLALGGDVFRLRVADNGKGLDGSRSGTGQQLVGLLVAQLEGELHAEKPDGSGAAFLVTFPAGRRPPA
jgi:two-component sensor histidine kinase